MIASIVGPDLLLVLLVVLVLFGGSQIPKLARSIGSAKTEFERATAKADATPAPTPNHEDH